MSEARTLQTVNETQVIAADANSIMAVISRAAADPNTDVDKLERLLGMYERITAQQAKAAYTMALAQLQPMLPVIVERGKTDKTAYATWEDINDGIRPLLHEHGFALSFRIGRVDSAVSVTGVLSHQAGHSEETTLDLPVDASGSKNAVQAVGSSVSYGKRYTAIALLNITSRDPKDRDDDGVASGARGMGEAARRALSEVNLAETSADLVKWQKDRFPGIEGIVTEVERKEIVRLWNQRAKALKEKAGA